MTTLHVIYENPSDYPDLFVYRRHVTTPDGGIYVEEQPRAIRRTLEEIREELPAGLVNIGRFAEDDPVIKEVWI